VAYDGITPSDREIKKNVPSRLIRGQRPRAEHHPRRADHVDLALYGFQLDALESTARSDERAMIQVR
jgi:hypothetical protein